MIATGIERFGVTNLRSGDVVQLRFTGDRSVPARLGLAWAIVRDRYPARGSNRRKVEPYCEPGVFRRVTIDQIQTVERNGHVVAKRVYRDEDGSQLLKAHYTVANAR